MNLEISPIIGIVENEPAYRNFLRGVMQRGGYPNLLQVEDGLSATDMFFSNTSPNLMVVSNRPPGIKAGRVVESIRDFSRVPIIVLGDDDRTSEYAIEVLYAGADDYIVRKQAHGNGDLFLAKMRSILRRVDHTKKASQPIRVFHNNELSVDCDQRLATLHGRDVSLTPTQFRLLECLIRNTGRVVVSNQLLKAAAGHDGFEDNDHWLRENILRLRGKLEESSRNPNYIVTERGIGYLMPKLEDSS